jgi:protein-L-isoaspartate(D-aspartate) O-methyltransferase
MTIHSARINMVTQQLRTGDVLNERVLALFERVPRHEFVPEHYADFAYSDMQIPLEHGQRMLTPLEEGIILQALDLTGEETLLEVGTGTGFLTAMLSHLVKKVISVDCYPQFTQRAQALLTKHKCTNVELVTGDASRGWLEKAPYDVMVVTGAIDKLSESQLLQVVTGGKILAIEGKSPALRGRLHHLKQDGTWEQSELFETDIPYLVDALKPKEFVF